LILASLALLVIATQGAPDLGEATPEVTQFVPDGEPQYNEEDLKSIGANPSVIAVGNAAESGAGAGEGIVPLHRYFNIYNGDHFYTTNWGEVGNGRWGYRYEGKATYVFSYQHPGTVPLYRWFNPFIGDHFYSINVDSGDTQRPDQPWTTSFSGRRRGWRNGPGWRYEGVQCYVFPRQVPGALPVRRFWSGRDHFYTMNFNEASVVSRYGYNAEGIEFFGLPSREMPQPPLAAPVPPQRPVRGEPAALHPAEPAQQKKAAPAAAAAAPAAGQKKAAAPVEAVFRPDVSSLETLDLSAVVNTDSRQGQYHEKDSTFETFPFISYGTKEVNGVKFNLVDPRVTGANVVGFRGGFPGSLAYTSKPKKVVLSVNRRMEKLHILGLVGGWGFPHGGLNKGVLRVTFLFAGKDTSAEVYELKNGVDIFDFNPFLKSQYPAAVKGGSVAVTGLTSTNVDLRMKTIQLANKKDVVQRIVIETLGSSVASTIVAMSADLFPKPPSKAAAQAAALAMVSALKLATSVAPKETPEVFAKFHLFEVNDNKIMPVYRYTGNGDHMYTSNANELGVPKKLELAKGGYTYEGKGFYLNRDMTSGFSPLFRYYNRKLGDHLYTTNVEGGMQVPGTQYNNEPYRFEGIIGYCAPAQQPGTSPLHRYWNGRDHFYTLHAGEIGTTTIGATGKYLYKYEGVQCYVYSGLAVAAILKMEAASAVPRAPAKAAPTARVFSRGAPTARRKAELAARGVEKSPSYALVTSTVLPNVVTGVVASDKTVKAVHRDIVLLKNDKWFLSSNFVVEAAPKDVLTFTVDNDAGKQAALFASFVVNRIEHVTRSSNAWRCSPKVVRGWRDEDFDDSNWRVPSIIAEAGDEPYGWGKDLKAVSKRAAWIGLADASYLVCRYHLGYTVSVRVSGLATGSFLAATLNGNQLTFSGNGEKAFAQMVFRGDTEKFEINSVPAGMTCTRYATVETGASTASILVGCSKGAADAEKQDLSGAFTADSSATLSVDGVNVGRSENWNIAAALKGIKVTADSVITAVAVNGEGKAGSEKVRGFIGSFEINGGVVRTGAKWRCTNEKPAFGWKLNTFDDSNWDAAKVVAEQGDKPWYVVSGVAPGAKWIWGAKTGAGKSAQKSWCRLALGHDVTVNVEGLKGSLRLTRAAEGLVVVQDGSFKLTGAAYDHALADVVDVSSAGQKCFTVGHKFVGAVHHIDVRCHDDGSAAAAKAAAKAEAILARRAKRSEAQALKVSQSPLAKGTPVLPTPEAGPSAPPAPVTTAPVSAPVAAVVAALGLDKKPTAAPRPVDENTPLTRDPDAPATAAPTDPATANAAAKLIASVLYPVGKKGQTGEQGQRGGMGSVGRPGEQGPEGPAGPAGVQGEHGPQGNPGPVGPQGGPGKDGPVGFNGPEGPDGPAGNPGPVGPVGPAGPFGPAGPTGRVGPFGPQGERGPVGPQGPPGAMGPDGGAGPKGPKGPEGPRGPAGPIGPNGYGYKEFPAIKGEFDHLENSMDQARENFKSVQQLLDRAAAVRAGIAPQADSLNDKLEQLLKMKTETEESLFKLNQRIEATVASTRELQLANPDTAGSALAPHSVRPPAKKDRLLQRIVARAKKDEEARVAQEAQARLNIARAKLLKRVAPLVAPAGSQVSGNGQLVGPDGTVVKNEVGQPITVPAGATVGEDGKVRLNGKVVPASAASTVAEALPTLDPNSPYRVVALVKNYPPQVPGGPVVTSVQPIIVPKEDN